MMWMVEAYDRTSEDRIWAIDLLADYRTIGTALHVSLESFYDAMPVSAKQAKLAISKFSKNRLSDVEADEGKIVFFLTAFAED